MPQDEMTALEEEQQDRMSNDELQTRIIALFEQLPPDRQEAVLEALTQMWDLDDDDQPEPSFHGDHFD